MGHVLRVRVIPSRVRSYLKCWKMSRNSEDVKRVIGIRQLNRRDVHELLMNDRGANLCSRRGTVRFTFYQ